MCPTLQMSRGSQKCKGSLWTNASPEDLPQCCAPNTVLSKQVTPAKPGGWGADSAQWGAHPANPSCRAKQDPPRFNAETEANPKPTSLSEAASVSPHVTSTAASKNACHRLQGGCGDNSRATQGQGETSLQSLPRPPSWPDSRFQDRTPVK